MLHDDSMNRVVFFRENFLLEAVIFQEGNLFYPVLRTIDEGATISAPEPQHSKKEAENALGYMLDILGDDVRTLAASMVQSVREIGGES